MKCEHVADNFGFPLVTDKGEKRYMKCRLCGRSYPKFFPVKIIIPDEAEYEESDADRHLPVPELPEVLLHPTGADDPVQVL